MTLARGHDTTRSSMLQAAWGITSPCPVWIGPTIMPPETPVDSALEARLLGTVRALVAKTQPACAARVVLGSEFEHDLGLDSLARVELLRLSGKFGASGSPGPTSSASISLGHAAIRGLPQQAATLTEGRQWHADHHPQRTHALLYGDDEQMLPQPITYAESLTDARQIATGLLARGLAAAPDGSADAANRAL